MKNPQNPYIIKILGDNLRKIRKAKKLTIVEAAELCGVEKITISRIELCNSNPTVSTIYQISQGLNIGITELLAE